MPADRVTTKTPWHIVLVLDDSYSMQGDPAANVNKAVETMIDEMRVMSNGTKPYFKVSILRFGSDVEPLCTAVSEQAIDMSSVTTLAGESGSTNAAGALDAAVRLLEANPGQATDFTPYVFFLSDGEPDDAGAALKAGSALKSLAVAAGTPRLITIGFGDANDDFMRNLATNKELYKKLNDHREVTRLFPQIGTIASSQVGIQAVDTAIMNL